jgi:hypothetical protein
MNDPPIERLNKVYNLFFAGLVCVAFLAVSGCQRKEENTMAEKKADQSNLGDVFDLHVKLEFVEKDVDATMKTMTEDPYVHNVPTNTGGSVVMEFTGFIRITLLAKCPPIPRWNASRVRSVKTQ